MMDNLNLTVTKLTHNRWAYPDGQYSGKKESTVTDLLEGGKLQGLRSNREYYEQYRSGGRYVTRYLPQKETPNGKTRVFVSIEGESMWDDFERRTSRPHTLWAQPIKDALIRAGFPADVKLRWSQKAGCSCPCSPAFFVTGGPVGHDLWATIAADTVQSTDLDTAADRGRQLAANLAVTA